MEQKTFDLSQKDGIQDLGIGLSLLCVAAYFIFNVPWFMVFPILTILAVKKIRKELVQKRIGDIVFAEERETKIKITLMISVGATVLAVLYTIVVSSYFREQWLVSILRENFDTVIGVIFSFKAIAAGFILKMPRYFYAGFICTVIAIGSTWTINPLFFYAAGSGVVFLCMGVFFSYRFFKNYPVVEDNE